MALELPAKNRKVFINTLHKMIKSFQNMSSWQLFNLSGQQIFPFKKKRAIQVSHERAANVFQQIYATITFRNEYYSR